MKYEIGIKKLPKSLAEKYNMLDYSHGMIFTQDIIKKIIRRKAFGQ